MNWLIGAGFVAITLLAVKVLLSDPYKRRDDSRGDSGDGGGSWIGGGGDCGGDGGD